MLALWALVAAAPSAQGVAPDAPPEAAHRLPFGSSGHRIELTLGQADGHAGPISVDVSVPTAGRLRASVHDVLGREVAVLADGERPAGGQTLALDARALAAGVYVVRVAFAPEAGGPAATAARRLTVVR